MTGSKRYDLHDFQWVDDKRIAFTVTQDNLYARGLLLVDRDLAKPPVNLNERDSVQMLGTPDARPDRLLVWVRGSARNEGRTGDLVELNLKWRTERGFDVDPLIITATIPNPPGDGVRGWLGDRTGEIRYAVSHKAGAVSLYRREPDGKWTKLAIDLDSVVPLTVDANPDVLLVARLTPAGLRELVRLNTRDGTTGPVLHTDPKYDFSGARVQYSGDNKEPVRLTYARQAPLAISLTEKEARLQGTIDAALPADRVNLVTNRSRDGSRVLIRSLSDRHPGTYYLFEPENKLITQVANLAPWLPEELLGSVRLMTYKARDNLQLDAYVTLPANYVAGKPCPMIVLPHGGPWVRDAWGYDPESQFFASRGYVVFRPNYRGSTGYNAEISLKPRMEFRKMHEDVTDGVHMLINAGIADPAHIAIVGSSFGGYLAACGAAFEPGLYKCAVSIAGVFDWERTMKDARRNDPESYRYEWLLRGLGDPKLQREKFEAMSPLQSAAQIKIPFFIAHGQDDRVADSSQSHRLAKILRQAKVPCETMFEPEEGHGFSTLKNRVELYQRIEVFLKKYI
jgi:dipeptidyl aminopeptidase/acylaminoacyl peptidase